LIIGKLKYSFEKEYILAYEFYFRDGLSEPHLIGILPERRKDSRRINKQSVLNWVRGLLSGGADVDRIFFIEVTINESSGAIYKSRSTAIAKEEDE